MLTWLQDLPVAQAISDGAWWFPTLEAIHVIAAAMVVGIVAMLDLRLVYLASRRRAVTVLAAETLSWVWAAFVVAVLSGGLLFASSAVRYSGNTAFLIKMGLLILAGINMAAFHRMAWKRVHAWDQGRPPAWEAQLAGGLSLVFWLGVVICGRWIGFS